MCHPGSSKDSEDLVDDLLRFLREVENIATNYDKPVRFKSKTWTRRLVFYIRYTNRRPATKPTYQNIYQPIALALKRCTDEELRQEFLTQCAEWIQKRRETYGKTIWYLKKVMPYTISRYLKSFKEEGYAKISDANHTDILISQLPERKNKILQVMEFNVMVGNMQKLEAATNMGVTYRYYRKLETNEDTKPIYKGESNGSKGNSEDTIARGKETNPSKQKTPNDSDR